MDSIFLTKDGSHSIESNQFGVPYHSRHGAFTESLYVFIAMGLHPKIQQEQEELKVLEIGFGSGLNAFLTALESIKLGINVHYTALEAFPCPDSLIDQLNFTDQVEEPGARSIFSSIHNCPWETSQEINKRFTLEKKQVDFLEYKTSDLFDVVYLDAFAPTAQPELWDKAALSHYVSILKEGGILTTYCAKGQVRRDFMSLGCQAERLPGPPGKREMLRITKK